MKKFLKLLILGVVALLIIMVIVPVILGYVFVSNNKDFVEKIISLASKEDSTKDSLKSMDFSEVNQEFGFSAQIPIEFEAEYVPQLRAINVYDPNVAEESFDSAQDKSNIEKSQIYITYFKADNFLTLNTVDITKADEMTIGGRKAILYEITKKTSVPDFAGQPNWRNFTHKALDIRVSESNPSIFYSFAYNPKFGEKSFNDFIDSLSFQ